MSTLKKSKYSKQLIHTLYIEHLIKFETLMNRIFYLEEYIFFLQGRRPTCTHFTYCTNMIYYVIKMGLPVKIAAANGPAPLNSS